MKALVIGYGSIGSRHARLLQNMGFPVKVVSGRQIDDYNPYKTIAEALADYAPDYVVITNETGRHYNSLAALAECSYRGLVLVEKPLFDRQRDLPENEFEGLYVGYNLRFHPVIQKLRDIVADEKVLSFHVYVGQYLPGWRPNTDYRHTYSASKALGGGVLRDLSHELDYTNWLLDGWRSLTALGGHYSHLETDSDDIFSILATTRKCPVVTIQLNYLDRHYRREILFNTDKHTIKADFINATLTIDDRSENYNITRDFTYIAQHKAVTGRDAVSTCPATGGVEVLKMIEAAEKAVQSKGWVFND
ncbi:Gfo/Idh/MocA family protein [Anaeroselena agilis]|uniref:GFO/IDH/MocA-like oxidoreductase domain-containing protein n=1 Tax=Anaeroselena agilis TaxID=3063788 RepID=A0ABU3P476_9FIRM|nr:hypothetical protein [Selenomonadales bacterium 4137-cl]